VAGLLGLWKTIRTRSQFFNPDQHASCSDFLPSFPHGTPIKWHLNNLQCRFCRHPERRTLCVSSDDCLAVGRPSRPTVSKRQNYLQILRKVAGTPRQTAQKWRRWLQRRKTADTLNFCVAIFDAMARCVRIEPDQRVLVECILRTRHNGIRNFDGDDSGHVTRRSHQRSDRPLWLRQLRTADGSVTVWIAHKVPAGQETNWVQTMPGKSWNTFLRLYVPLEPWFDKTWKRETSSALTEGHSRSRPYTDTQHDHLTSIQHSQPGGQP
jgi:hypothetical protein